MKDDPERGNRSTNPGEDHSGFQLSWNGRPLNVPVHRVWFRGRRPWRLMLRGECLPEVLCSGDVGWTFCNSTLNIPKSIDMILFAAMNLRDLLGWQETKRADLFVHHQPRAKCFIFESYMDTTSECRQENCWLLADLCLASLPELKLSYDGSEVDSNELPTELILRRENSEPALDKQQWLREMHESDATLFPEAPPKNLNNVKPNPRTWWGIWRPLIKAAADLYHRHRSLH
eukprot:TRINITY_DN36029_c0_g1_i4.p1 TRINITY_DN36029_c0_g1~~TRINITY_DN36029_c0_g1_i4.p1  ORF type:complete len:231 (+),score=11.26 TRINITY_DN36029_c0_g1_i4:498-1190(+)